MFLRNSISVRFYIYSCKMRPDSRFLSGQSEAFLSLPYLAGMQSYNFLVVGQGLAESLFP